MFRYFGYSSPSPSNSRPGSPAGSTHSTYSSYSISPMSISSSQPSIQNPSCAYPSWPRRSSLDGAVNNEASSFISDDDLFSDVFDDNDSDCTPIVSPCRSPHLTPARDAALFTVQDLITLRDQQPNKQRRRSSRKSKGCAAKPMSPIQEVGEWTVSKLVAET